MTRRWARYYRDAGLSVIPLRPRDKRPALQSWREYQGRLPTDAELKEWWPDGTDRGIGIICGGVSGLIALDFDAHLTARSFLDLNPEFEDGTIRVMTARGQHIWLQVRERVTTVRIEEIGLDVKATGSYIVAPPSIHPSGKHYAFANESDSLIGIEDFNGWLRGVLEGLGVQWQPPSDHDHRLDVSGLLGGLGEGNRNETFAKVAGKLHRGGWTTPDIIALLTPHAEVCGFPLDELGREINGISSRYAIPEPRGRPMLAGELIKAGPKEIAWRIRGYVREGGFTAWAGRPKGGKSTSAAYMARAVARGEPIWGMTTKQGKVLILALEEHEDDVVLRLRNLGITEEDPIYIYAGSLKLESNANELRTWIEEDGYHVVIVDTLARLWNVEDENSNAQIAANLEPLLAFARQSGVSFVFLCQLRKTTAKDVADVLGGTELAAMMDVVVALRRDPDDRQQRVLQDFSRYSQTPENLVVRLEDDRYEAVGQKADLQRGATKDDLLEAVSQEWKGAKEIAIAASVSIPTARPLLEEMVSAGLLEAQGKLGRGGRRLYREGTVE